MNLRIYPALNKQMYYVYILKSKRTDKLYTGYVNKIFAKIKEHNLKKSLSTKGNNPYKLIYFEGCRSKADAIKRGHNLKYFGQAYRRLKERISDSLQNAC